jgi:hypothetical protein
MSQITCFVGPLITTLLVSAVSSIQPSGTPDTVTEQAIFRPLLARTDRSSLPVVVDARPLPVRRPTDSQWEWFGDSAAALKSPLEDALMLEVEMFSSASFPPATTLVSHAELPLRETATSWAEFVDRFGPREVLRFSRPVISQDRRHALVYRAQARGPQDGRTDLFLLRRQPSSEGDGRSSNNCPFRFRDVLPNLRCNRRAARRAELIRLDCAAARG